MNSPLLPPFAPVLGPDRWCLDLVPAPALGLASHALARAWSNGVHGTLTSPKGMAARACLRLGAWTLHFWQDGSLAARHGTYGILPFPLLLGQRRRTDVATDLATLEPDPSTGLPTSLHLTSAAGVPYPVPSAFDLAPTCNLSALLPPKGWLRDTLDGLMEATRDARFVTPRDVARTGVPPGPQDTFLWWMPSDSFETHRARWKARVAEALPKAIAIVDSQHIENRCKGPVVWVSLEAQAMLPRAIVRPATLQRTNSAQGDPRLIPVLNTLLAQDLASMDACRWTLRALPGGQGHATLRHLPVVGPTTMDLGGFPLHTPSAHARLAARAWLAAGPQHPEA